MALVSRSALLGFVAAGLFASSAGACLMSFGDFAFSDQLAGSGGQGGVSMGPGGQGGCVFCDGSGGGGAQGGMGSGGSPTGTGGSPTGMGGMGGDGGGPVTCNNPNACPGMDGDCEFRTCENNVCGIGQAAKGTLCNENGGDVCDGMGTCVACGSPPVAPGGACPTECTGGCNANKCFITCDDPSECASANLVCPAGFDCQVTCSGASSCASAIIDCPSLHQCTVVCNAASACASATVNCSADGPCNLGCGNMQCASAVMNCGNDACNATCQGGAAFPTVNCNNACQCNAC
ncbi:MAG: hypothetical protein KC731_41580 [Myxococcales bacterium]|nr:hypothetical protein [Myxococcales bacterium]